MSYRDHVPVTARRRSHRRQRHGRLFALVVGSEPPVVGIAHDPSPDVANDSGYTILLDDAPEHADDCTDDDMRPMCLGCVLDAWPECRPGLDLARQHGTADRDRDTGEWTTP